MPAGFAGSNGMIGGNGAASASNMVNFAADPYAGRLQSTQGLANFGYQSRQRSQINNFDGQGLDLYNMFGFQQNQVTLQDAFKFLPFTFPNLTDNNLKHVNLQNQKLWALTHRNQIIAKADLANLEGRQPALVDD